MSDRPSNAFFGVLRLMFLYVFFFFGCSKNYDPTYKDDFYAVLPDYNHEDKSAKRATSANFPFPRQPAERWSSRRTDNVPLSRRTYEPSWREYPSNRTYEPYHEENLSRVNLGQQYTSREEMACSTRIDRTKPTKAKSPDLEKGCQICYEEDAFKNFEAKQCDACKEYICQPCHDNIKNAAQRRQNYRYDPDQMDFTFQTTFACPFCKKPF